MFPAKSLSYTQKVYLKFYVSTYALRIQSVCDMVKQHTHYFNNPGPYLLCIMRTMCLVGLAHQHILKQKAKIDKEPFFVFKNKA